VKFQGVDQAEAALAGLREHCRMVKVLGRFRAAVAPGANFA
jgi:prephenate dehydratase